MKQWNIKFDLPPVISVQAKSYFKEKDHDGWSSPIKDIQVWV